MSYSVKLTEKVVRKLVGWGLTKEQVRQIRKGLNTLATSPKSQLIRVGPPIDALQYDMVMTGEGAPRRDALYTFTVRYGADEQTLFIVECELLVEDRPPL